MRLPKQLLLPALLALAALAQTPLRAQTQPVRITVGAHVLRRDVKRFGINLGGQNFYDSGQILRNLVTRNPGFQGQTWQSILRCTSFTRTACVAEHTSWPAGFLNNASFQVATGSAAGASGTVRASTGTADSYTVQFASALSANPAGGDYLIVRAVQTGDPTAGWWPKLECGATASAELHDLPPGLPALQVLRIDSAQPCQRATLTSYFDSTANHRFVRLNGSYTLHFQARPLSGTREVQVRFARESGPVFLSKTVALQPGWHTYTLPITAAEKPADPSGAAALSLAIAGASVLLADVSLAANPNPAHHNPTAFRDEVVETLRDLRPGILRYMDSGTDFGTSLDDWLEPAAARPRTGYSLWSSRQEDIALGLDEFLTLAQAVGTAQNPTEPWISLPAALSPAEARRLIEYLAGPPGSPYGALRTRLGHPQPWTALFPRIHLELGNEQWNRGSFAGATIDDPAAYAERTSAVFAAMRATPGFSPTRFNLVAGSFFDLPSYTATEAAHLQGKEDTLAVAPYLFSQFNDAASTEAIFGPMLAQPEQWTTLGGLLRLQSEAVHAVSPALRLSLYEVNLGTVLGSASIPQAAIDRTVPSTGAALATGDLMLLALRDLGITDQCFFALTEFRNGFTSPGGAGPARTTPLFGAVVDMGGATDRRRPSFYMLQLINRTVLANLIETTITAADPTWNQPRSPNSNIALPEAHLLQTFAFGEPGHRSLLVLNLSRTAPLTVTFGGINAPEGTVQQTILTSPHIDDTNETAQSVSPTTISLANFQRESPHTLPPFSMTAYTWSAP